MSSGATLQPGLPALREDIRLLPGPEGVGGEPTWAVFDPVRNRFFRISWTAFQLLSRWNADDAESLVNRVRTETTCQVSIDDVQQLIQFLFGNNLTLGSPAGGVSDYVDQHQASQPGWLRWLWQNYLFLRFPLVKPDAFFQRVSGYLAPLFSRQVRNTLLILGLIGLFLVSRQWDSFVSTFLYFFTLDGLLLYLLAFIFVKVCHELGHGLTATRFGCRVATMGIAFLVFFPVLYTDTTDAYRLTSRRKRLYVSAAGILTEFYLALICLFLWSFLPDGVLRSIVFIIGTVSFSLTLLINMNPFLRFDGYYFLSDWLGIENLQERAFAQGRWWLRELLFGLGEPPPENHPPGMRRFLVGFAWATWAYRLVLLVSIALVVYYFFFKLLGLILFCGVLFTFIVMPVMRELFSWWAKREAVSRRHAGVLAATTVFILLCIFVPWRSTITLPAIAEPYERTTVYAPVAGKIVASQVSVGDQVVRGQVLVVLESPEIEEEIRQLQIESGVLNLRLQRIAASETDRENLAVLRERLQESQSRTDALLALKDRMVIRSPLDGRVAELADALHQGRWINESLPLVFLVGAGGLRVQAILEESELQRISPSQPVRFVPDDASRQVLAGEVLEISRTNLTQLELPYLASVYGGAVAVRPDSRGRLIPETSVYRVDISLVDEQGPDQVIRGVAQVEGNRRSFARRFYEVVSAALVRGATF